MIGFDNVNWNDYYLTDFFRIQKGNQNNMSSLQDGLVPLVSAKKCDNGYKQFIAPNNKELFSGNIITLNNDGDGGAGIAYYQPFEMALDTHCTALIPKIEMSRYHMLFISLCITKQRSRFGHGHSINNSRLRTFKFMLPATIEGTPDWQFMEAYMKQQEQAILKPTIERLCKQLITNELMGGGKLSNLTWKEFVFGDEFSITATGSGIDKNKLIKGEGEKPYITRTDCLNGIDGFIPEQASKYRMDEGNVITIGLDTQTVFYQPKAFYTGQNIQIIRHPQLDKHNAMFLIVAIQKLVERFSWGSYGATLTRLRKSRIYLPANQDGEPDFAFMSSFMQQVEQDILSTTLSYFADKQQITPPHANDQIRWNTFYIRDVFTVENCKCNKVSGIKEGETPYIGATNNNNGVMKFIERKEELITKGNCIVFICDGEGSIGLSVYKYEDFIGTTTVKVGRCPQLNRYIGMFITTVADTVRGKYNFGYKRNEKNLKRETLTLPVTSDNKPDWAYMESYMRRIESEQILKYLQHYKAFRCS